MGKHFTFLNLLCSVSGHCANRCLLNITVHQTPECRSERADVPAETYPSWMQILVPRTESKDHSVLLILNLKNPY